MFMLLRACVAAVAIAALARAQSLSPIQAIKQEMQGLAKTMPPNVCPFGEVGAIVSPSQPLGQRPQIHDILAGRLLGLLGRQHVPRCFLPGLTSEARVMHDRIDANGVEQVRPCNRPPAKPCCATRGDSLAR